MSISDFNIKEDKILKYTGEGGDVTLPDGISEISHGAFKNCSAVTSVIIPEGVKKIGIFAFFGCSELKSISFPSTLTEIGDFAFAECNELYDIRIPHGVPKLQFYNMFRDIKKKKNVPFNVRIYLFGDETRNSEFDTECRKSLAKATELYFSEALKMNSLSAVRKILDASQITDSEILLRLIDKSAEKKAPEITAFLLEYKNINCKE